MTPRWERRRLLGLDWTTFGDAAQDLAVQVKSSGFRPTVIMGIARGGLPLATALGHLLSGRVGTTGVTRNASDGQYAERDEAAISWMVPDSLNGARVLLVDDIAGDGGTLRVVRERARRAGAAEVRAAVIVVNDGCQDRPEYSVFAADDWVVFPWECPPGDHHGAVESLVLRTRSGTDD
ncbi:phosphoribosyltransferase [Kribbella speibonae]|uniref:phosphoribosyltransferase n=1 Tax=Kribbella speibonae TaxID=1572660 RepID=UPI0013F45B5D|nr:phosphoribosyltransferase family protein [Kribbella speibonae]